MRSAWRNFRNEESDEMPMVVMRIGRPGPIDYIRKTLSLLFVLFLLATSRKSTDSGKYHLLEKRNPLYF